MNQPLGYTLLSDEQKARAAALMIAHEARTKADIVDKMMLATFIIDGPAGVVVFMAAIDDAENEEPTLPTLLDPDQRPFHREQP